MFLCSAVLTKYCFLWIQFFRTEPYACEPSSLPRYPPCKERDVKLKYEKHKRFGATLCTYCSYFLLFIESFNVCLFFRKSRVNGSVERHRNRQHASQNPGRRVFTPDANNKPQANPKVRIFSPFSFCKNLVQPSIIMLKFPPLWHSLHQYFYSKSYTQAVL